MAEKMMSCFKNMVIVEQMIRIWNLEGWDCFSSSFYPHPPFVNQRAVWLGKCLIHTMTLCPILPPAREARTTLSNSGIYPIVSPR